MTRLMTVEEYADALEFLREQETPRQREAVAEQIEIRVLPLDAETHRVRALKFWRDTPAQQAERYAVIEAVAYRRSDPEVPA